MVTIEFDNHPTPSMIDETTDRIKRAGAFPRGIAGGRALEYDDDTETLTVDFDQLARILLEHRMYEDADGFNATEIGVLRVVETGPERMRFDEIRDALTELRTDQDQQPLEDSTIHHYLRNLREKNLISHYHNQYTYAGP